MEARCQCSAVRFTTPLPQPLALYICHCSSCRRQTSSAFGASAIFPRFKLPDVELLSCYARPVASGHTLYCYFCRNCGTRLFHTTPTKNVVSIKGGCISGLDWSKAIHIWTNQAMVPIPEDAESHPEEAPPSDLCSRQSSAGSCSDNSNTVDMLDQPGPLTGSGDCDMTAQAADALGEVEDWKAVHGKEAIRGGCELSG